MAENNNDDALSEYLEAWVRKTSGMEWHDQQVASLKEELAAASSLAQQATVKYLLLRGRFNLRGLMGENKVGGLRSHGVDVHGAPTSTMLLSPRLACKHPVMHDAHSEWEC